MTMMNGHLLIPILADLRDVLEHSADVIFALDRNLRLVYRNPAWDQFAAENGAPELANNAVIGTDLFQVIGEDLLGFYIAAFERVGREGTIWECLYECSSPQVLRKFRMQIQPLAPSGYLVRNNLVSEQPQPSSAALDSAEYVNSNSLIVVCMHCRCSQRVTPPFYWEFVPAHLERGLPNVSHSLCPVCLEYFYPKAQDAALIPPSRQA